MIALGDNVATYTIQRDDVTFDVDVTFDADADARRIKSVTSSTTGEPVELSDDEHDLVSEALYGEGDIDDPGPSDADVARDAYHHAVREGLRGAGFVVRGTR